MSVKKEEQNWSKEACICYMSEGVMSRKCHKYLPSEQLPQHNAKTENISLLIIRLVFDDLENYVDEKMLRTENSLWQRYGNLFQLNS